MYSLKTFKKDYNSMPVKVTHSILSSLTLLPTKVTMDSRPATTWAPHLMNGTFPGGANIYLNVTVFNNTGFSQKVAHHK